MRSISWLHFFCLTLLFHAASPISAQSFSVFFNDLAAFNEASGAPPVIITFDDIGPGTYITGDILSGLLFDMGNAPGPSAPLIVARGADTFTPPGFVGVRNSDTNKLFPTSGENVLSPGGVTLAPGFNSLLENDDLLLSFEPPVQALGFDILYQSLDCCSFVAISVYGLAGETIYSNSFIPSGSSGGCGQAGGSEFVGFVSESANIKTVLINDFDGNNICPDSNIGFDSFRFKSSITVQIDIKPGSEPNSVNPRSKGLIPVAILTTNSADGDTIDFDAWDVDPWTLRFGPNSAVLVHAAAHAEDVDGDGDIDMVAHFRTRDTGIACGATTAILTGETLTEYSIEGTDGIKTVGCSSN